MKRLLATLTLALSASALANSGCTALYATVVSGGVTSIDYINTSSRTSTSIGTLPASVTTINSAALNPQTGEIFYVDRTGGTINTLYRYNPTTNTNTLVAPVTRPNTLNNTVAIGATFNNSGSAPRLFLMYGSYIIQEVNPTTGAVIRNITLALPATDLEGNTIIRRTIGGNPATSGDLVFNGVTAYAITDTIATIGGTNVATSHLVNLGDLGAVTGTAMTAQSASRITRNGNSIATGIINGLAITPYGETYATYTVGGVPQLGTLPLSGTTTPITNETANGLRNYNDLSDCVVTPAGPTLTKTFIDPVIYQGGTSRLRLTLSNTNPTPVYTQNDLTDNFPAGMTAAATPSLSTTCLTPSGAPATLTNTSTSVTLGANVKLSGSCEVGITVTAPVGTHLNSVPAGSLNTTGGSTTVASNATLTVQGPVTGTLQKQQRNVTAGDALTAANINAQPGQQIEYCLSAVHDGSSAAATTATLRDTLNSNLTLISGGYGAGRDVRYQRNGGAFTYGAAGDGNVTVSGQSIAVNLLPFSNGVSIQVCFQVTVRATGSSQ